MKPQETSPPFQIESVDNSFEYVINFYLIKTDSGQPINHLIGTFVWNQKTPVYLIPGATSSTLLQQAMTKGVLFRDTSQTPTKQHILHPQDGLAFLKALELQYGQGSRQSCSKIEKRPITQIPATAIT